MEVVVGRIGRAHGIHGDVHVDVRTDEPDRRFTVGATLQTVPAQVGPLTVERTRWHSGRLLVGFSEANDRTAAELLRGTQLVVDVDPEERPADPDEYYDRQLVGLTARNVDGSVLGTVSDVLHLPAQDLLAVVGAEGREVLVPFVAAIVPEVDLAGRVVVIDPPVGLFDDEG